MGPNKDYRRLLGSFTEIQADSSRLFTEKLTRRGRRAKERAAKNKKK